VCGRLYDDEEGLAKKRTAAEAAKEPASGSTDDQLRGGRGRRRGKIILRICIGHNG